MQTLYVPRFLNLESDGSKPNVRKGKRVKSWTIEYTEMEGLKILARCGMKV